MTRILSTIINIEITIIIKLILIIATLTINSHSSPSFIIKNNIFYDNQGREVNFHGVNLVQKHNPQELYVIFPEVIHRLKSWGMNAVRINIVFSSLYPQQGPPHLSYLNKIQNIVTQLGQNGIYTILQFHQNAIADNLCGNGLPKWLLPKKLYQDFPHPMFSPAKFNQNGDIVDHELFCSRYKHREKLFTLQGTYAQNKIYQALYNNQYKLLDKFKKYWQQIAKVFISNPYIIAYQLLNQPWPGHVYTNKKLLHPGSQHVYLQKFHDQVSKTIRQIDPHKNIAFQPLASFRNKSSGYKHAPGGQQYSNTSVFSFHFYKDAMFVGTIREYFQSRVHDTKRLGASGLLTEFLGGMEQVDQEANQFQPTNTTVLDLCDQYHIGWIAWHYKTVLPEYIVRPYAQRIAGTKIYQSYNSTTNIYHLNFRPKIHRAQTVIFLPKIIYFSESENTEKVQVNIQETPQSIQVNYRLDEKNQLFYITVWHKIEQQININGEQEELEWQLEVQAKIYNKLGTINIRFYGAGTQSKQNFHENIIQKSEKDSQQIQQL